MRALTYTAVAVSALFRILLGPIMVLTQLGSALAQPAGMALGEPPRRAGGAVSLPSALRGVDAPPLASGVPGLWVDTGDRASVVAFFNAVYLPTEDADIGWTGSLGNCTPGQISQSYRNATVSRVNYFRAMAGVPADVTLDEMLDDQSQDAALMMSAAGALSHSPSPAWPCYTAAGAEAADGADLALGIAGAGAISGFVEDPGPANYFVGHRRWILYPPQVVMGSGSVPARDGYPAAEALWVLGPFGPRPAQPDGVAWPPRGYVPYQVVPARWSFSYPGADFSGALVSMSTQAGATVPVALEVLNNDVGYADNTLVWVPQGIAGGSGAADTTYHVRIDGVMIDGTPRGFTYDVTTIDPSLSSPALMAAVLPSSRSVQVGTPASAFVTVINGGATTATAVRIALRDPIPASLAFWTTDPHTNAVTGTPNAAADIAPGQSQTYLIVLTPTAPFDATDVAFVFGASNVAPAVSILGVNTLLLSASAAPVPDVVALAATVTNDGIVNIPGVRGTGAFAVASVNVGASGLITASAGTGAANLPVNISLCQTDPSTGQCRSAIGPTVTTQINANATPTFGIFVTGTGSVIPFDPANNRIFVRFKDANGVTRGATSVAVRTQ